MCGETRTTIPDHCESASPNGFTRTGRRCEAKSGGAGVSRSGFEQSPVSIQQQPGSGATTRIDRLHPAGPRSSSSSTGTCQQGTRAARPGVRAQTQCVPSNATRTYVKPTVDWSKYRQQFLSKRRTRTGQVAEDQEQVEGLLGAVGRQKQQNSRSATPAARGRARNLIDMISIPVLTDAKRRTAQLGNLPPVHRRR